MQRLVTTVVYVWLDANERRLESSNSQNLVGRQQEVDNVALYAMQGSAPGNVSE